MDQYQKSAAELDSRLIPELRNAGYDHGIQIALEEETKDVYHSCSASHCLVIWLNWRIHAAWPDPRTAGIGHCDLINPRDSRSPGLDQALKPIQAGLADSSAMCAAQPIDFSILIGG